MEKILRISGIVAISDFRKRTPRNKTNLQTPDDDKHKEFKKRLNDLLNSQSKTNTSNHGTQTYFYDDVDNPEINFSNPYLLIKESNELDS